MGFWGPGQTGGSNRARVAFTGRVRAGDVLVPSGKNDGVAARPCPTLPSRSRSRLHHSIAAQNAPQRAETLVLTNHLPNYGLQ